MPQVTFNGTKINVEFTESSSRQQLNSGENISTLFGKIKKIFSDLKAVCFSGSYNDLSDKPSSLPANGGNADTVNGRHSGRIATLTQDGNYWDASAENINDAYLQWDGATYFKLRTFGENLTAVDYAGNADTVDGLHADDFYTSGNKPYVTGDRTLKAGSDTVYTNHGFTPSAVFWWMISEGRALHSAYSFDNTSFRLPSTRTSDVVVNFIIFR